MHRHEVPRHRRVPFKLLPQMNGEALIVNFRRLKPGAPVIAMSAGPGEKAGADLFFPKPYSTAAVREALKEMLYA